MLIRTLKDTFKQYSKYICMPNYITVMLVCIIFRADEMLPRFWLLTLSHCLYAIGIFERTMISECIITTLISCKYSFDRKKNRYHFFLYSLSNGKIISEFRYINKGLLNYNIKLIDWLRNKSWKPECVGSFSMDWGILLFYPEPEARDKIY
jgi:hypothetical protein